MPPELRPQARLSTALSPFSTLTALTTLSALWAIGLGVSFWIARDRLTWLLEVFPALLVFVLLWRTRQSFPLTPLLYALIALHGLILMLGGAYTYAHVPLGFWMQDWFGFARNNYDKIGHFAQGFVPALAARELLMRKFGLRQDGLVAFLCISICLAFSALYEIIEWWSALILGQGADEFLGTQGDPWDTQSDMLFALIGAGVAMLLLRRWHDRQMRTLPG
jgi:putative membrane protein